MLAEAAAETGAPFADAIWGAGGVIVGAAISAATASRRERVARRAQTQRAALYDLQDAALTLRRALRDYGAAGPEPSDDVTDAYDEARGRVEMLTHRIVCAEVRERVDEWVDRAERAFLGDEDTPLWHEVSAWKRLQAAIGEKLRGLP